MLNEGETAISRTTEIAVTFVASPVQFLLWECPAGLARTPARRDSLQSRLDQAWFTVEDAVLHATDKSVPTGKHRVFAVAIKQRPGVNPGTLAAKLTAWKLRLQERTTTKPTVGAVLGRQGHFFLKRRPSDRCILSFSQPIITIAWGEPSWGAGQRSTNPTLQMTDPLSTHKTCRGETSSNSPLRRRTSGFRRACGGPMLHRRLKNSPGHPSYGKPSMCWGSRVLQPERQRARRHGG